MRTDLELLRLARLSGEYDPETVEMLRVTARAWLAGEAVDLAAADTAFLVEALFKCGHISEANLVAKQRAAEAAPATSYDDLAQQYARLASYDFALPATFGGPPLFPPEPSVGGTRVLSLYHSSITFQTSGYTVRTQALLTSSKLEVVPLTRIGYPWAARLAKSALAKLGKETFESTHGGVTYRHRRGLVGKQGSTFSNIALGKHEILKAICEIRPHVVHAASNFTNALPALLAAREAGLPFVYEMRGLWELTAGVGVPGWLESERYALERRIETFVAQNADRIIVLSDVQKRELVERGVETARVKVVVNGHEPQRVVAGRSAALLAQQCPDLVEWIGERIVVGYAGAVAVYEGLQDLVAAYSAHREAWSNVAIVIAGDGPYSYQLAAQVAALGLEGRVKLLGRVPGEVADALYGLFDLCVLPRLPDLVSQLITPLKTVEILSHGKVLLASNVSAMAEQLERYGFGETFRAGDRADLARQLGRILNDLPLLKQRYAAATARISESFSWDSIAVEWDDLLREAASAPPARLAPPPARQALAPLYEQRPERFLEPLPLWRRLARVNLTVDAGHSLYLRGPSELDGYTRLLAMPEGGEIAEAVPLGRPRHEAGYSVRDLCSLLPGRYHVFLYVSPDKAGALGPDAFRFYRVAESRDPDGQLEALPALKREPRQILAFEEQHDAKNPAQLSISSEHAGSMKVAASYIPLQGAELNPNFVQRTKSRVTGARFHYITVEQGVSELALFPRLSGRLLVELTPWGDGEPIENRLRQVARVRLVARDAALFPALDRRCTNVLVAANINETLLDGSTIWLKTLVNALARVRGVNVYVATNALHVANGVTAELFDKPNVAKVDLVSSATERTADLANQIRLIERTSGGFDLIVVRGLAFAQVVIDRATRDRAVYYGAGMFRRDPDGSLVVDEAALRVASRASGVIFQNEQMECLFRERVPGYRGSVYCIAPCVEESALERSSEAPPEASTLAAGEQLVVYAGKLIREYGVLELVEAVRQRIAGGKPTRLVILGNKFDGRDPEYQARLEAALSGLAEAVTWLPAVPPTQALRWVRRADAVWGWRHGDFETSHFEISTKMVEAISCGTPIVLYPAPANLALMGPAYAGFGEQPADAAQALSRLLSGGKAGAAALCSQLASRFQAGTAYRPLLERVSRAALQSRPSQRLSVLVAAHDFRFFEDVEAYLLRDGHAVSRETWKNHTQRYTHGQARAAAEADIIFCEWCLGNAVWWSNNLPPGKRLFIRLHLQELSTAHPAHVDFSRVEKVIFISAHVMREAIARFGIPAAKCQVIPISVRLDPGADYSPEQLERRRNTLGMVGLTPWRKRPDKALELLHALRGRYPELKLHLKGHTPSEYGWMSNRKEELRSYQELFREVARLQREGVVQLSGYDDQLEAFYRGVGWILSLSDFEGCHTAVAEGGVMGCLPLMTNWGGADEVYPSELVQADFGSLLRYFDAHYQDFDQHRRGLQARFQRLFGIDAVFEKWRALLQPRSAGQAMLREATL